MVKYCQKCGSQLVTDDSLFCSKCGTKVSDSPYPQKNVTILSKTNRTEEKIEIKDDDDRKVSDLLSTAISLHENGDDEKSLPLFCRVLRIDPQNREALLFKENIQRDMSKKSEEKICDLLTKAIALHEKGDDDNSLVQINKILSVDSSNIEAILFKKELKRCFYEKEQREKREEIQKKNIIFRENYNKRVRPEQLPIVRELIKKYISGCDEDSLSSIDEFVRFASTDFEPIFFHDDVRMGFIQDYQKMFDENKASLKKCQSFEERDELERVCRHQKNILGFLADLEKLKKIIDKKKLLLEPSDIISVFREEFTKEYERKQAKDIASVQEYLAPFLRIWKEKLGLHPDAESIIKEVLSCQLNTGKEKVRIVHPLVHQWILHEFEIPCDLEEISDLIERCQEELELEEFENNLGKQKTGEPVDRVFADLSALNGYEFEEFLKDLFEKMGYSVFVTPASKDQGADLILSNNVEKIAVQAKKYSGPVSNSAIQQVVAAMKYYEADKAMVVTTSVFTPSAVDLAYKNEVILWDGDRLEEIISEIDAGNAESDGSASPEQEVIDSFIEIMAGQFDDMQKLDETTTMKYIIRLIDNDLRQTEGLNRAFRENRLSLIQGIFERFDFDTNENTIAGLYDSVISDMDLQKIPNNSVLKNQFTVTQKSDESGQGFLEFICPVCDEHNRMEIMKEDLRAGHEWSFICPRCSLRATISGSKIQE